MNTSSSDGETHTLSEQVEALSAEVARMRTFMEGLETLSASLESAPDEAELHTLLAEVLERACEVIGANDASLLVLDEDSDELVFMLTRGTVPPEALAWRRIPASEGVAGWVVKQRRATLVNNAQADERFYTQLDMELQFRTESILAAPIIGDGNVLGVIEILNKTNGALFNIHDQLMLGLLCRMAGELLYALGRRSSAQIKSGPDARMTAAAQRAVQAADSRPGP